MIAATLPSAAKAVSLTCLYPNSADPGRGVFIRSRLQKLGRRIEVKVVAPVSWIEPAAVRSATKGCRQDDVLEILHPRWFYIPGCGVLTAILFALQTAWNLRSLHRRFHFDVIDAHFGYLEGIAAWLTARLLNVPFTVTFRGCEVLHGRYPARRWLISRVARNAGRVITVSERLSRFAVELGANPARVKTIPNGIDSSIFHPRDRIELRRELGFKPDERVLLTAGHLIELKGHQHAISALQHLLNDGTAATLLIAGGLPPRGVASFEPQLRQLVTNLHLGQQVRFLGHVPPARLAEIMCAADLFCLLSSREGWPNVVHEAMACGTPIVACDVGAVPEMIPSQRYGIIVPPGDPERLYQGIKRALETTWDRDAIAAWAQQRSWEQVALEAAREIEAVLAESRGGNSGGIGQPIPSRR